MMKIFISDAVVSRGYDGAPAIRLFNSENGGEFAVFQVGIRKYDSRAENNLKCSPSQGHFSLTHRAEACPRDTHL